MNRVAVMIIVLLSFSAIAGEKKNGHFKRENKHEVVSLPTFVVTPLKVRMPDQKVNNATLVGIDSDNDGIRDDIQIWIDENFNNKPSELKLAFKQYAIQVQSLLSASNDKAASIQATFATLKAQDCIYSVSDILALSTREQEETRKKIDLMYLNTKERIEKKLKADENFHGQEVTSLSKKEACNF